MALATADNYDSWGNGKVVLVGYATVIGIGGLIGNGLVIFLFIYFKYLRTVTNNFIINLAVCDFVIAILDLVFSIPSLFASDWIFGNTLGILYAFGHFVLISSSMVMLAIIAVDRYHVIARPKVGSRITTVKSLLVIAVVYIYTLAIASPILYAPAGLEIKIYVSGCYIDFTPTTNFGSGWYALVIVMFLYVVPLITIAFYYWKIFTVLRRRRKHSGLAKAEQNRRCYEKKRGVTGNRSAKSRAPARTLKLMAALVGLFLVTWTPYMAIILARAFDQRHYFNDFLKEVAILLTKSVVILNPVAYALVNHRFQKCVAKLFCCAQVVIGGTATDNSLDLYGASRSNHTSTHNSYRSRWSRQDNVRETFLTIPDEFRQSGRRLAQFVYNDSPVVSHNEKKEIRLEKCFQTDNGMDANGSTSTEEYQRLGIEPSAVLKTDWEISITTF